MCIKIKTVSLKLNELRIKTEWQVQSAREIFKRGKGIWWRGCIFPHSLHFPLVVTTSGKWHSILKKHFCPLTYRPNFFLIIRATICLLHTSHVLALRMIHSSAFSSWHLSKAGAIILFFINEEPESWRRKDLAQKHGNSCLQRLGPKTQKKLIIIVPVNLYIDVCIYSGSSGYAPDDMLIAVLVHRRVTCEGFRGQGRLPGCPKCILGHV